MNQKNLLFGAAVIACSSAFFLTALHAVAPTDNPVETHYTGDPHFSDYAWVDTLAWENVYNILDYGGVADGNGVGDGIGVTDNTAAFQAAVDAAHAAGGGVVYLPTGTYFFSSDLYLKSGVVVRGDTPVLTDAQVDGFAPPSKMEFPRYFFDPLANGGQGNPNDTAFKHIYADDNGFASEIGLVWLDINRAGISLAADGDGTDNRLVFGTRSNNVARPDPGVPQLQRKVGGITKDFQKPWQRLCYRFSRNIHVFGQRNILIANNRVNDKHHTVDLRLPGWQSVEVDDFIQVGYVIQDKKRIFGSDSSAFIELQATHQPYFKYTNHYGIYARGSSGSVWGAAPHENPRVFRSGLTVRDNWVYTTMRVGYHHSGWGLKILNNIKKDLPNKVWWLHPTGLYSVTGAQTLENRGIDISGSNILVEGNDMEVVRHRINNGTYLSTDGEGVLVQECCGGSTLDDVTIRFNTVNAYIGIYKMPYTRNINVIGNTLTGAGYIMVNANKNGTQAPVFNIDVSLNNFSNSGDILVQGFSGGNDISIQDNTLNGGDIKYPDGISTLSGNSGFGSLVPEVVGLVRDYPVLELEDPSTAGIVQPGETMVRARVTGSLLDPAPASAGDLPDITQVDIYANATLLESFSAGSFDPGNTAWLYETAWNPAPGYYQLSAKAVPAGYSGPTTSTEWFTVSDVIPVYVTGGSGAALFADFLNVHYPGITDPAIIGDGTDTDMDGLTTLMEFAVGGNPTVADSYLAPRVIQDGTSVRLIFRLVDDLGEKVHYRVQKSSNMSDWSTVESTALARVTSGGSLPAGVREYEYILPSSAADPVVLRLEIRRKP